MGFLSSGGLRMSDGMSDRASRSASGRIPGPWAIWSRYRGPRRRSRGTRIVQACAWAHEGPTVPLSAVIYEARGLVPATRAFSPSRGYVSTDIATIVSEKRPVRTGHTVRYIIHVACWKRHRDLHRRKSRNGESRNC